MQRCRPVGVNAAPSPPLRASGSPGADRPIAMTERPATLASGNHLLATLSPEDLHRLRPTTYEARLGAPLFGFDTSSPPVIFPHAGAMVSAMRTVADGLTVEVGVIGAEGVTPLDSVLAPFPARSECIVQIAGPITAVSLEAVRDAFATHARFREAVLAYTCVYLDQVSQHAVCNRLHSIEQRLAKWLLVTRDRAGKDDLDLTQEFLAHMLGVHRPGVTIAINALVLDGAIRHSRGNIVIQSVDLLEQRACECRAVLREGWQRLMK